MDKLVHNTKHDQGQGAHEAQFKFYISPYQCHYKNPSMRILQKGAEELIASILNIRFEQIKNRRTDHLRLSFTFV